MSTGRGPAIQMDRNDHLKTGSWGNRTTSKDYRNEQKALLTNAGFMTAMAMDVFQIKSLFGSKYDAAISEAVAYVACLDAVKAARKGK